MPTTPLAGLPYPSPTDAPNVPLFMQQLAESVEQWFPARKQKATSTSLVSNTIADDPHLQLSLGVGWYLIEAYLNVTGIGTADYLVTWSITGGVASSRLCRGPATNVTDSAVTSMRSMYASAAASIAYGLDGTNPAGITETLLVQMTAAGTVKLRHAQAATQAGNPTVVAAASHLIYRKLTN